LLADLMAKKTPQISAEGLDISRYDRGTSAPKEQGDPAPVPN